MGFGDFFEFDEHQYEKEISLLTQDALQREYAIILQKCLSAKASMVLGCYGAAHTAGASLIFSGMALRRNIYNEKKKEIIEKCMEEENWEVPEMRKRDVLMAVGPAAVAAMVAPGAESLTGHFAGDAATAFVAHHTTDMAHLAIHNTAPLVHAVHDGFNAQVSAVAQGLTGHAAQLIPIECVQNNTTEFIGSMAGQALASTAEIVGTKKVAGKVAGLVFDKYANPKIS